ncbi:MAG: aminoacyl-histidine dipeptidase [Deltaproteobacteria bacterium]|nr:aminoacyl-histidine dipeptidase [Deltaproteobacteria bacterium]
MTDVLAGLEPKPLWQHFEKLCAIPRPSKKEGKAAAHIIALARSWGLPARLDEAGNVIVSKPATPGMENRRTTVLQAHLDMVPQRTADSKHDFERDPILPRIDGQAVRATGTTLGADNGIGVATALSVLQSKDLAHGPIEALFTVDEETGMSGANGLKEGLLHGDLLLNLDSEDEGEICIGCAGGADLKAAHKKTERAVPKGSAAIKVAVAGLKGGHSGVDIHLGRGNANKVLARVLTSARHQVPLRLSRFAGGDLRNAIPRSAEAVVVVAAKDVERAQAAVAAAARAAKAELAAVDPGLTVTTEKLRAPQKALAKADGDRVLDALVACPHGAFAMVRDMPTVTETSNNLAIVDLAKGVLKVHCMFRSSVDSKKTDVAETLRAVFELLGAEVTVFGAYPGWAPDVKSQLLAVCQRAYSEKFGKAAKLTATHGGLECGIIRAAYPHMEAVSIGPTIRYPHSPDEHVDIPSVTRFWTYLSEILRQVPVKNGR